MISERQIAWATGYFDGEGSVSLHFSNSVARRKSDASAYRFRLRCGTTDEAAVYALREIFGGLVNEVRPTKAGRPVFAWQDAGAHAIETARLMIPYSLVKRERLILFVEAWERKRSIPYLSDGPGSGRGGHRLDPSVADLLRDYSGRIATLNQKGPTGAHVLPELGR